MNMLLGVFMVGDPDLFGDRKNQVIQSIRDLFIRQLLEVTHNL